MNQQQDSQPMTRDQWDDLELGIVWSITRPGHGDGAIHAETEEEWSRSFGETPLDLSAPEGAPDGHYTAVVSYGRERSGRAAGVQIRGGQFVPEPTARAVLRAVCRCFGADEKQALAGVHVADHIYVEKHRYEPETGAIHFSMGS